MPGRSCSANPSLTYTFSAADQGASPYLTHPSYFKTAGPQELEVTDGPFPYKSPLDRCLRAGDGIPRGVFGPEIDVVVGARDGAQGTINHQVVSDERRGLQAVFELFQRQLWAPDRSPLPPT